MTRNMIRTLVVGIGVILGLVGLAGISRGQSTPPPAKDPKQIAQEEKFLQNRMQQVTKGEADGIAVRIKDMARFRGVRSNQLVGMGVVIGLEGTGDTRRNPQAAQAIANYFKSVGQDVDPLLIDPRNVAFVFVTADLPPFSGNGQKLDVNVASSGDATNLRGGTLLTTELYAIGDRKTVYAVAQGNISTGGIAAAQGGNSAQVGFRTGGRIPEGAIVERGAPTKLVFDGKMYLELGEADFTTVQRMQQAIAKKYPEYGAVADSGGTLELSVPNGISPIEVISQVEMLKVMVDNSAIVVINEKTGTIAIGGNVKIAPVVISSGTISVRISEEISVSQPNPLGKGSTQVISNSQVDVAESDPNIAVVAPNTTIADLARIFQELRLKSSDIINILQTLKQAGALKAKLVIQ